MKTIKKLIIIAVSVCAFMILINLNSKVEASGDLYLNNLNFDVQVNSDGSMDVTERWDIDIEYTNTLYKTFNIDKTRYSDITNVEVKDVTSGIEKILEQSYSWSYHMPEGTYYGGLNNKEQNEIAWGVGLEDDKDTRSYLISYHVTDAIAKYTDYAELYWQFVGKDFEVSAKQITGTIKLPSGASDFDSDKIKIWGHTEDLNGTIFLNSNNEIEFTINNFRSGRYVEIRSLFPTELIYYTNREQHKEILQEVINEETVWANEANERRKRNERIETGVGLLFNLGMLILSAFCIKPTLKARKEANEIEEIVPTQKYEYFREIPRKDATPAEALAILKKEVGQFRETSDIGNIFASTLLDLSMKKYIEFIQQEKEVKIKLLKQVIGEDIKDLLDEAVIFNFLRDAINKKDKNQENNEITFKELKKHIRKEYKKVIELKDDIDKTTEERLYNKNLANEDNKERKTKAETNKYLGITGIIMVLITLVFILTFVIIGRPKSLMLYLVLSVIPIATLIWFTVETSRLYKKIEVLTQQGIDEHEKWKGLKKFMEEFSMLDKREIPELALWEEYLIYATAFGIADKVIKQLKIVYPNYNDEINISTYTSMHLLMNSDFSSSFSNSISSAMSSTYSSASGGGGGFSGGGGGRRPEVAGGRRKIKTQIEHSIIKRREIYGSN